MKGRHLRQFKGRTSIKNLAVLAVLSLKCRAASTMKKEKKFADQKVLRSFLWTGKPSVSKGERLVESTVTEWYDAKHRKAGSPEIGFLNSLHVSSCPLCGNDRFSKWGHGKDGLQRYRCHGCGSRFTPITGTIFDSRKIPISEWIEYLLHLFEFHSIRTSAYDNRNASTTGKYWLLKVFQVLKGIQDEVVLAERIWLDETFFAVKMSDAIKKDGKLLRGISSNRIGVAVAVDSSGRSVFIAAGASKPSERSSLMAYGSHIEKGSLIIHDSEKSHNALIEQLGLRSRSCLSRDLAGLPDNKNPLRKVNRLHGLLKRFMREHGGFDRDRLQDWLNLFYSMMNGPKEPYEKVLRFIERAARTRKVVRYRDAMKKKALI